LEGLKAIKELGYIISSGSWIWGEWTGFIWLRIGTGGKHL